MVIKMWARIENNVAVELTEIDPEGRFHPDLIWHACGTDVQCGWTFTDGQFIAPEAVPADLEQIWQAIKASRDERKSGGVSVLGCWYHSDADSRIQWLGTKDTARDMLATGAATTAVIQILGQNLVWKTMGGEFVPVTIKMALEVVEGTKTLDAMLFAHAEQLNAQMRASPDPAGFDITQGWPARFEGVNG